MRRFSSTAVILFLRDEVQELQRKNLLNGSSYLAQRRLLRQLNSYAVSQVQSSGLPYFIVQGEAQHGNTFGERLAHATASVYALGYDRVLLVGNDCPELATDTLLHSAANLEEKPVVIGPATDGGIYLLGLHRSAFDFPAFADLAWERADLQRSLLLYLEERNQAFCLLPAATDIDKSEDWQEVLLKLPSTHFIGRLIQCLLSSIRIVALPPPRLLFYDLLFTSSFSQRGPPAVV